ncbi:DUF2232 domain-containing protein [Tepidicaulis sp.]|uniref:DUF2232 domain-containing protein n=1 Tax=Tepidicaulis sp. TaxID=1920809 RepID=UPI003B5BC88E
MPQWIIGLGAGLVSAVLFLTTASGSLLALLPLLLSPIPLFVAGLGWGGRMAAFSGAAGFVFLSLISSFSAGLTFFLFAAFPAFWLSRQALFYERPAPHVSRRGLYPPEPAEERGEEEASDAHPAPAEGVIWCPPGDIAVWAALVAALLLVIAEAGIIWVGYEGLAAALRQTAGQSLLESGAAARFVAEQGLPVEPQRLVALAAALLPAAATALWLFVILATMAAGQRILMRFGHNLRPMPDFDRMELPRPLLWAFGACFLFTFIPGEIAHFMGALIIALFIPYFLLGLAIIHAISRAWKARIVVLGLFYFLLLFFGWLAVPVGLLGMMDPWLNLRGRLSAASGSPGKERD